MIGALFFFLSFLLSIILTGSASECQVSPWGEWSECFGDCETALVVRNRDVTVPPLPTPGHRISFRPCPHLYEVKSCKPKHCLVKEDMPTPGPLPMMKKGKGSKETRKGKELKHPVFKGAKTQNSEESPLSFDRQELLPFTTTTAENTVNGRRKEHEAEETTRSSASSAETGSTEKPAEATTEESKTTKEYYINTLTLDLPIKSRLTVDGEKRLKTKLHIDKLKYRNFADLLTSTADPIMNDVLRQLETAAENNAPLDEKQIRSALKKNKKLVKALVDAYRNRQTSSGNSTAAPAEEKTSTATSSNVNATETTIVPEMNNTSTMVTTTTSTTVSETTTTPKFWPKQGYVPNTRKHASEITSKLYMTREIIQALSEDPMRRSPVLNIDCLENRRCCKVTRETCANGAEPVKVKRYYRPRGSSECVAYEYPRCSQVEEMDEQPIQFIQNCQDLCFNTPEKRISPLYAISREV